MTHKLILKVKKFQLSSAKGFGTMDEKPPGDSNPPYHLELSKFFFSTDCLCVCVRSKY